MKSLFTILALTTTVLFTATAGATAPVSFDTVSAVTTVTVSGSAGINL